MGKKARFGMLSRQVAQAEKGQRLEIFKRCRQQSSMHRTLRGDGSELFVPRGCGRELRVAECMATNRCNAPGDWLHGSFSSSKRQMAVLGPIVEALVRRMVKAGSRIRLCRTVRAQLISEDPLGNKAIALHQRHEQALGRPFVTLLL